MNQIVETRNAKMQKAETQKTVSLEQERCARRKAEAANQAKDDFFAFFLHELKNPLNAVYGWSRLLSKGNLDSTQSAKAIETISRNTDFLKDLVNDLFDAERIASGKMEIESSDVNLCRIVKDALDDCQPAADSRNILLAASFDCSECIVAGDAKRLRQVVGNLLSNALKFSSSGGFVTVDLRQTRSEAQIVVKDSGIGIRPEFLPHVFDRFRQDAVNQHRENKGLGLGLAIVRYLVELHAGSVAAGSEGAGKGAVFTVKLPRAV